MGTLFQVEPNVSALFLPKIPMSQNVPAEETETVLMGKAEGLAEAKSGRGPRGGVDSEARAARRVLSWGHVPTSR